ncbi:glycoside hydrolase family 2 protein [Phreatobacter oligotrophus]|uniref:glycoside hydrolase family 2 protein n=1 Tax=Phreatobacter oligotrophus TaxID=1122261 RepID=UPI0023522028|nr:glycoside hydrolase family 2 protein [Phreatobacter oligotrophus]MBX9989714.1 glycoside hydrolase family 2 protein [Phreatobacter oligotrophus]
MQPVRHDTHAPAVPLDADWLMAVVAAGSATTPDELDSATDWISAPVPGTAEQALIAAGRLSPGTASGLHDRDVWYRREIVLDTPGTIRFEGLTAPAEIFLDGAQAASVASMFVPTALSCPAGRHALAIRFPPLNPVLAATKGPRARWRPMMIQPGTLRLIRTTTLGHMPGWSPDVAVVGPWQDIHLLPDTGAARLVSLRLNAGLEGHNGVLDIAVTFDQPVEDAVEVLCAGRSQTLHPGTGNAHAGRLLVPDVAPWWPNGLGDAATHGVQLRIGDRLIEAGRVGFRTLAVDRGPDGQDFGLVVNGVPVFCRGASWTPPDPAAPGVADPRPLLELARDAGMTMIRLSGTMGAESLAFHAACDALGLLVWHDLPFANFDYPTDDPAFRALVTAEVQHLLGRLAGSPSLAVVCGGSEMAQQATMLGLKPDQAAMPFFEENLPQLVAELAPQAAYVPHTPWGGALPFVTNAGVTHYFGVGAYRRPIEDARRADVRFASECLAFAALPSAASLALQDMHPADEARWSSGVPRDAGADWDFEDVRDHYVGALFGVDPAALRASDPERWLALGRAAPTILMEAVFAEWRRAGSRCRGGLVWLLADMKPGAGWGLIDRLGEPKSTWHALRRAFRPLHLGLTDEGLNGLGIHLVNETRQSRAVRLTLACYGDGPHPLARAERDLTIAAGEAMSLSSHALLGRFFDIADAYRFGPRAHQATLARLHDPETGALLAEASHVLPGCAVAPGDIGLSAQRVDGEAGPALAIATDRFAHAVTVEDAGFRAGDEGFCLAPGERRVVPLVPRGNAPLSTEGRVTALNSHPVAYEHAA